MQTDGVDESIMNLLREDGRLSNREVARRLDVSEGTVRQRLKKLEDANAIRMGVVVDPVKLGIGIGATVLLTVQPRCVEKVLDAFCKLPEAKYVATIMGPFNIFVSMTSTNLADAALFDRRANRTVRWRGACRSASDGQRTETRLPPDRDPAETLRFAIEGRGVGRREWVRTTDPHHVKVVL